MFANKLNSGMLFALFNTAFILTLFFSSASPTDVDAASSISAQADSVPADLRVAELPKQSKLQVVSFAPQADSCTDSCAQSQTDAIASCDANLDPIAICGGDAACEAEITAAHDFCITNTNTDYSACTATCATPSSCTDSCVQAQTDGIASCDASLDPSIICGGDAACEAEITAAHDSCIANTNTDYSACTTSCAVPPVSCNTCVETHDSCVMGAFGDPDVIGACDAAFSACSATCVAPPPSCTTCDQNLDDAIVSCNATFDPLLCGGDIACEADLITQRDACIADANAAHSVCAESCTLPDSDSDSVFDSVDNCPVDANTDQSDLDGDGLGDVCDPTPNGMLDQTITVTINAPASAHAGDVFTVEATASSGLPVTYSALGSCSNEGPIFTIEVLNGDNCSVHYDQPGDSSYNPASQVIEEVVYVNSAPVITDGETVNVTMSQDGSPIPFNLTLHMTDLDVHSITWTTPVLPQHGTVNIKGSKLSCQKKSGYYCPANTSTKISYTPTTGYFGTDSFDVEVSDGELTDTITVNVTIEKTNTSVVTLLDSQGNGLEGATVQYYLSGWHSIPGSTDADGELSYDGLGLSGNLTFRITYANASIQKQQNITDNPEVIFQTQLVSMQLLASDGSTELNGDAQYYSNGWRTFSSGSTSTSMELLPLNYTFRVSYGGASIQKQQNIANDPVVIFQTKLASMQLLASNGATELVGTGEYYANGWKTFGNGSTSATMELLPVNYTFRVSYGGASIQKQQDVNTDADVLFQTKLASMQLLASDGTTELIGTGEYYANGWKTFSNGSTSATMELLPVNYTFRVSYGGASIQKQQDVNINAAVVFQTKQVTMQLLASNGTTELVGAGEYYANGWKTFGNGSTTTTMELLPANYTFRVSYGGASVQKAQDVNANQLVIFQTGQVHSNSARATQYYANGWKTFTQNMELLPGSYPFKFNDGTPQTTYTLTSGSVNNIH